MHVLVEPNKNFRLPENGSTPIIMIGAGTGVAPFPRFYAAARSQWQTPAKTGLCSAIKNSPMIFSIRPNGCNTAKAACSNRADLAWSRQGAGKVYVQHKLAAAAAEVWQWLQQGAHIYVCGDAGRMARDVEQVLLNIIADQGKMSDDDAADYLNDLREEKRYQRDVY